MTNGCVSSEEMELLDLVHRHYGYDFRNYAPSMVKRRLASFIFEIRCESIS